MLAVDEGIKGNVKLVFYPGESSYIRPVACDFGGIGVDLPRDLENRLWREFRARDYSDAWVIDVLIKGRIRLLSQTQQKFVEVESIRRLSR